jgi:hypothetical protein
MLFLFFDLTLRCPVVDRLLGGGLLMQGITEVSGESATGKTQFALQALLQVLSRCSFFFVFVCLFCFFRFAFFSHDESILPEENGGLGGSGLYLSTEV